MPPIGFAQNAERQGFLNILQLDGLASRARVIAMSIRIRDPRVNR
jgi:hypothetical protein